MGPYSIGNRSFRSFTDVFKATEDGPGHFVHDYGTMIEEYGYFYEDKHASYVTDLTGEVLRGLGWDSGKMSEKRKIELAMKWIAAFIVKSPADNSVMKGVDEKAWAIASDLPQFGEYPDAYTDPENGTVFILGVGCRVRHHKVF